MKKYDLILKNGTCYLPTNNTSPLSGVSPTQSDIAVKDGKITEVGTLDPADAEKVLDLNGLCVFPGLIDTQVHFREPGLTHKEDLFHGTKGAVLGGITGIFEMPNTKPGTTDEPALQEKLSIAEKTAHCNYAFYMGATTDNLEELDKLEQLPGAAGIKVFMGSSTGSLLVSDESQLDRAIQNGKRRMAFHCEYEPLLIERKLLVENNPGRVSLHPEWRNVEVALKATQIIVKLAKKHNRPVHILHITTKDEIEFLHQQKEGTLISVETTPQHLTLSAPECYDELGTLAQMNPPIRTIEHQNGLWEGVKNNTVDIIGSDHAPHTLEEKLKNEYPNTPSGMTGVQTSLPLLLDHYNNGKLTLERIIDLMCLAPCRLFKVKNKGAIANGFDADFTVVDPEKQVTITNEWIASKSGWTPFHNKTVKGWPTHTIIAGNIVMQNDQVLLEATGKPFVFE